MADPLFLEHPVEYVRNAESLWGKLKSGRYDWIGVGTDGQFVVGRPRMGRLTGSLHIQVLRTGATGEFVVTIRDPYGESRNEPCATREDADELFDQLVADFRSGPSPLILRVTLHDKLNSELREELIVHRGDFPGHRTSSA